MTKQTRLRLRAIQASPLVAVLILVALFSTFPITTSIGLFNSGPGASPDVARWARVATVDSADQMRFLEALGLAGNDQWLPESTRESYDLLLDRQEGILANVGDDGFALDHDDPAWQSLRDVERRRGVGAWAWLLTMPARPALVTSATANPGLLEPIRNQMRLAMEAEAERVPAAGFGFEDFIYYGGQLPQGKLPPIAGNTLSTNTGSGGGGSDYWTADATIARDGQLWRVIVVMPPRDVDDGSDLIDRTALERLNPDRPDADVVTHEVAEELRSNIFVFGPIKPTYTALRAPKNTTPERAEAVRSALFPWWFTSSRPDSWAPARSLPASMASELGIDAVAVHTWDNGAVDGGAQYGADETAPQTVLFLMTWEQANVQRPSALATAVRDVQRFVAAWFPTLAGFAFALLGVSLVASGSAFVFERRLIARERVQEELARMRRDAHDKVYNRLSALSKRVSAAGDAMRAQSSSSLSEIAEDIRGTVGEIQQILGDEGSHTYAGLTQLPLSEQLSAVCSAQAARLGIEIECSAADELPEAPAALGWDLQCVTEEGITNAVRHGRAGHVWVTLTETEPGVLRLVVSDDGVGSRVRGAADAPESSSGLRGMLARAERWGGGVQIDQGVEGGTVLVATFHMYQA